MKKLLKFLFFVGFAAGVLYVIKQALGGPQAEGSGTGVLPETPVTPAGGRASGREVSPAAAGDSGRSAGQRYAAADG